MKLKQIGFKIVSIVMVFTLLFSISATTIGAIELNDEIKNKVNEKYEENRDVIEDSYAAVSETVAEVIAEAKEFAAFVSENYEEIYADTYAELYAAGYIHELDAQLGLIINELADAQNAVENAVVDAELVSAKDTLGRELSL
nr:hypothetical protein [Oscillospiraceae bacterium]